MKIAYNSSIFFLQKHGGISRYFCSIIKGNNAPLVSAEEGLKNLYSYTYIFNI